MSYVNMILSINCEGYKFIGVGVLISLIFLLFYKALLWIALFFRNQRKILPKDDSLIISSADGVVFNKVYDDPLEELKLGKEKRYRIILMAFTKIAGKIAKRIVCMFMMDKK